MPPGHEAGLWRQRRRFGAQRHSMKFLAYPKRLAADPLFLRVCTVLWCLPIIAMGVGVAIAWHPDSPGEWLGFACLELFCLLMAYPMSIALFGSDRKLFETNGLLADGGELPGMVLVVFVMLLALPITACLRAVFGGKR